jgi:hypothetical protein
MFVNHGNNLAGGHIGTFTAGFISPGFYASTDFTHTAIGKLHPIFPASGAVN